MATSTYKATLKYGAAYETATKLLDIQDFPDLGGEPEQIETTTLSDEARTYIAGIKDQQAVNFTALYDQAAFLAVNALNTKTTFYLEFNDTEKSVFTWDGTAVAYVNGAAVNETIGMTVTITPATPITLMDN